MVGQFLCVVLTGTGLVAQPSAVRGSGDAPPEVSRFIADVYAGVRSEEGVRALSVRDDAAPFVRVAVATATGQAKRDFERVLRGLESRAEQRNVGRYFAWVSGGRYDLCIEFLAACPDKNRAAKLFDLLRPKLASAAATAAKAVDLPFGEARGILLPGQISEREQLFHAAGSEVDLPHSHAGDVGTFVRAERLTVGAPEMYGWVVVVRSAVQYTDTKQFQHRWQHGLVLSNDTLPVNASHGSFILADGDVELGVSTVEDTVIVSNGSIRFAPGGFGFRVGRSFLAASGDITLPGRKSVGDCYFHAGGVVTFDQKVQPSLRLKENQKEPPLGIRFLSPKDFGLDVAVQNGGVQVMGVTPDSPFAKFGVADADVIVTIDDVRADSLPALRRQLRRGVLKESVTLGIRRGNERLTRIVFLEGVPEPARPVAPPPREVRP